jgi:mono/diheme cytochrome c family protein
MNMKVCRFMTMVCGVALLATFAGCVVPQSAPPAATLDRGRHLVLIGHCNNCHTPGYIQAAGKTPEELWLTGSPLGWRSKSGTSYAPNLRLFVQNMSEQDWIKIMRTVEWRPPMPWWSVREHTDDELSAMYEYIRSLRPLGKPAPSFLPPDQVPPRPYHQLPDMS